MSLAWADFIILMDSKELVILKSALSHYEQKNYKKCIKVCDENAESAGNSSELLALKGISLHSIGKIESGYEYIKKGLQLNYRSGLSWHLYSIMLRIDKKYTEAVKSLKSAIKQDPSNLSLLKDLSLLYIQIHDFSAFLNLRLDLLSTHSNSFMNISAVAFGLLTVKEYLPYLYVVKSLLLLSNESVYFPAILGHSCRSSLDSSTLNINAHKTIIVSKTKSSQESLFYSQVENWIKLNLLDEALYAVEEQKKLTCISDKNLLSIHVKVLAEKACFQPSYHMQLISLLEDIFEPEVLAVEGLVQKLVSIHAWNYLYYYIQSEVYGGNIEAARKTAEKILYQCLEACNDTYEFSNYCFKKTTFTHYKNVQHIKNVMAASRIFGQILAVYLYSLIVSSFSQHLSQETLEPFKFIFNVFRSSWYHLSIECQFLTVILLYITGSHTLMRYFVIQSCLHYDTTLTADDLLTTCISQLYLSQSLNIFSFASVIPSQIVENCLALISANASAMKSTKPLEFAKATRLLDMYCIDNQVKTKLMSIIC